MFGINALREDLEAFKDNLLQANESMEEITCLLNGIQSTMNKYLDQVNDDRNLYRQVERLDEMIRMMKGAVQTVEAERITVNAMRKELEADHQYQIAFLGKLQKSIDKFKRVAKKAKKVKAVDDKNNSQ